MQVALEISMYPLDENFGEYILNFIKKLRTYPELSVRTNAMSTQIFGEYDAVMTALQNEMKPVFEEKHKTVLVMKIVNADLDYEFE